MDSRSFKTRFPGDLTTSWKAPIAKVLLEFFLLPPTIWSSTYLWWPWVRQPLLSTWPMSPSLFTNSNSRNHLSQSASFIPAPGRYFQRNFLDLFVSSVWYSQLNFGKLKSPLRARAVDTEIFLNTMLTLGLLRAVMRLVWRMDECHYQGKSLQSVTKFFQVDEQMGLD